MRGLSLAKLSAIAVFAISGCGKGGDSVISGEWRCSNDWTIHYKADGSYLVKFANGLTWAGKYILDADKLYISYTPDNPTQTHPEFLRTKIDVISPYRGKAVLSPNGGSPGGECTRLD